MRFEKKLEAWLAEANNNHEIGQPDAANYLEWYDF